MGIENDIVIMYTLAQAFMYINSLILCSSARVPLTMIAFIVSFRSEVVLVMLIELSLIL